MKILLSSFSVILLSGLLLALIDRAVGQQPSSATPQSEATTEPQNETFISDLPDYGVAPEFHESAWLNTDKALRLSDLRGQVVLLEMWTFGCINCIHTLPYVSEWYSTYKDQGLVVVGNHYPEFSYESDINNVKDALVRLNVAYPVLQDNFRETWNAYNNRYWPTIYLIDKQGHVRYRHIGEGAYDGTEQAIQDLLRETYTPPTDAVAVEPLQSLSAEDVLNVRGGSGTDNDILGTIGSGEVYPIRREENGWYVIRFNGADGYVSGDYVTITQ